MSSGVPILGRGGGCKSNNRGGRTIRSIEGGTGGPRTNGWDGPRVVILRLEGLVYIFYGDLGPRFGGMPPRGLALLGGSILGMCHVDASKGDRAYAVIVADRNCGWAGAEGHACI